MAVDAATLLAFLLEPTPCEHLKFHDDAAQYRQLHLAELLVQLDAVCTQPEQPLPQQQNIEGQARVDVELVAALGEY